MVSSLLNAFTVDVEDYFQVSAFEAHVSRDSWHEFPCRVERNTHRILELLEKHEIQATFFILGWIARRYPQIVETIRAAGHEIDYPVGYYLNVEDKLGGAPGSTAIKSAWKIVDTASGDDPSRFFTAGGAGFHR